MDPPPAAKDAFPPTAVLPAAPKAAPTTAAKAWPSVPGYEILEEVGRGGMAVVYKARQIALDRIVALKTILPSSAGAEEERTRFLRKARVMALLQHPNVIQIHEIGYSGDRPFLAMEFMGGGSLAASLAGKPMSPQQAAALVAVLADAVQRAHQQGVIHRDLKPGNILLSAEGTAKIGDFGLAKWFALPNSSAQQTQVMGTPSYMAPEQAFGELPRWDRRWTCTRWGRSSTNCSPGGPPSSATTPWTRCTWSIPRNRFPRAAGSPRCRATWKPSA